MSTLEKFSLQKSSVEKSSLEKKLEDTRLFIEWLTSRVSEEKSAKVKKSDLFAEQKGIKDIIGVSWLRDWEFPFDGLDAGEIAAKQSRIEASAHMWLALVNQQTQIQYKINFFLWVKKSDPPLVLRLEAYLTPPAEEVIIPGGGPTGTIQPPDPPKP